MDASSTVGGLKKEYEIFRSGESFTMFGTLDPLIQLGEKMFLSKFLLFVRTESAIGISSPMADSFTC